MQTPNKKNHFVSSCRRVFTCAPLWCSVPHPRNMYPTYAHQSNRPSTTFRPAGSTGAGGGGGGYPGQAGYAVAPTAGAASSYGTQRSGYEQAYQTAGGQQGQYASKCAFDSGRQYCGTRGRRRHLRGWLGRLYVSRDLGAVFVKLSRGCSTVMAKLHIVVLVLQIFRVVVTKMRVALKKHNTHWTSECIVCICTTKLSAVRLSPTLSLINAIFYSTPPLVCIHSPFRLDRRRWRQRCVRVV